MERIDGSVIITVDTMPPALVASYFALIKRAAHYYGFVDVDYAEGALEMKLSGKHGNPQGLMEYFDDIWIDVQVSQAPSQGADSACLEHRCDKGVES